MELGTSFRAATISNPQSTPYNYSNPIRFPISNPLSFDTAGGSRCRMGTRGWSGKLELTFRNNFITEAVRKEKTGSTADHANSGDKKWVNFGLITESLSNGMFRVHLLNVVDGDDPVVTKDIVRGYLYEGNNVLIPTNMDPIIGYGSGKIRTNHILILPGDVVKIEVGPYDPAKGRIIYRFDPRELRTKKKEEDENDEKSKRSNGKTKGRKQKMSKYK